MRSGRRLGAASLVTGVLLIGFASPSLAEEVTGGSVAPDEGTEASADADSTSTKSTKSTQATKSTKARAARTVARSIAECDAALEEACTPTNLCKGADKLPGDPRLCAPKVTVKVAQVAVGTDCSECRRGRRGRPARGRRPRPARQR